MVELRAVGRVDGGDVHEGERGRGELELELIQSHMAQKPMLRGEVGVVSRGEPEEARRDLGETKNRNPALARPQPALQM